MAVVIRQLDENRYALTVDGLVRYVGAIEECERAFRDTRLRVTTTNIGLARLRNGTELVRIGSPLLSTTWFPVYSCRAAIHTQ